MNIFHKIARKSLQKNKTRTAVTVVGVALSAALITAALVCILLIPPLEHHFHPKKERLSRKYSKKL